MNRLDTTFTHLADLNQKALVGFITAGDPDYDTSLAILKKACQAGLDIIELGVPFSDPTCDGPIIQRASLRALKNGASLARTLALATELRRTTNTPIVLFSYYNPLFQYGLERLAKDASAAGVDGLLIVDLPPEEAGPLEKALKTTDIHIIRLAAPTTTPQRLKMLVKGAGGFLYLITRLGVTGTGGLDYEAVKKHAASVKTLCPLPVCLGFGISNGRDTEILAPFADGLVIGSALERIIEENAAADTPALVAAKIRELRDGMNRAQSTR